jgi:E3 ubiquitin-protein ligase HERC1
MCQELTGGSIPLLLPTPNTLNDTGYNRDRFLLNPQLTSPQHLSWFKFLGMFLLIFCFYHENILHDFRNILLLILNLLFTGILFGVAIRTKKPLAVPLAPLVWKLLVGEPVYIEDLEEVDMLYAQSLRGIRDIHLSGVTEANFSEVSAVI